MEGKVSVCKELKLPIKIIFVINNVREVKQIIKPSKWILLKL